MDGDVRETPVQSSSFVGKFVTESAIELVALIFSRGEFPCHRRPFETVRDLQRCNRKGESFPDKQFNEKRETKNQNLTSRNMQ